jgi:hypothetical protein
MGLATLRGGGNGLVISDLCVFALLLRVSVAEKGKIVTAS